ncbi:MAG: type ISP restriction/modification enzyme [Candidatus Jorgensenbacteria bacterium]
MKKLRLKESFSLMVDTSVAEIYIAHLQKTHATGQAGEHAYRPALESFFKAIVPKFQPVNDPKRSEHGAPDFIFMRGFFTAGYAETKDIAENLDKTEKTKQIERYLGYSNLILTNYLEFRFFRNGVRYGEPIVIGELKGNDITVHADSFRSLTATITDFLEGEPENIKSAARLAEIMGGKARRIRDNVRRYLADDSEKNADILRVYETMKKLLVHDLTPDTFADMYAQTLVYGLFVARFYDDSPKTFSREKARDLVPASNPFLRHFFDHIVGPDFDKRLSYIVGELCEIFAHADVRGLMEYYFKNNGKGGPDPVIHFYEDFLKEYDPDLRKKLGAFYTPLPVVRFIVRSVDYLLEKEFGLAAGLADTSKTATGMHRVQILDPAVGTGTFISAVIRSIYERLLKSGQKGRWPTYVHNDLLPRIHGFEIMMAPYTIAHLKLSMAFKETGFWNFHRRLSIYLTNSLEESITQKGLFTGFGFAESIAEESKEASVIKNKTPIMVVVGNPPYSVSSQNKGEWIQKLIKVYKEGLDERNIQPLSDDYIKFLRFAEHFIEKNGNGIVAMITNNSFLDGKIHRQMRKHLLETFDDVYVLDLHGSTRKKEKDDENVFSIQQGVAISIFVRKGGKKESLGTVRHGELYGTRESKFNALETSSIQSVKWQKLNYKEPYYFFIPKDFELEGEYTRGFKIKELFRISNAGSATGNDSVFVQMNSDDLENALNSSGINFSEDNIVDYLYRPFDIRKTLYDNTKMQRLRTNVMDHMRKDNVALITCKQQTSFDFQHAFLSRHVTDRCAVSLQTGEVGYVFPLFLYPDDGPKMSNLKKEIVAGIERIVGKTEPENIFYYIYAVLHSPNYREKYKEFLKIDFPRVPYPKDEKSFKKLVAFGAELRSLHLLESPKVNQFITTYPVAGSNIVENPARKDGKVFINKDQYFGNVPESAWNFYIGGYQPAQKWLKDRKGRELSNEEIEHYQKIIVALVETEKIMNEIDKNV